MIYSLQYIVIYIISIPLIVGSTIDNIVFSDVSSSSKEQTSLLRNGETVVVTFATGSFSKVAGSQGVGKVCWTYRANSNSLGPTRVVSRTGSSLTVRGPTTVCTLRAKGKISCKNGSAGRWSKAVCSPD